MATATLDKRQALKQLRVDYANDWCPGCGDFGILGALQQALAGMGRQPHEVVLVGGIGCSGKAQYYVNCYACTPCTAGRCRSPPASSWPTRS